MQIKNATLKNLTVVAGDIVKNGLIINLDAVDYTGSGSTWQSTTNTNATLYNTPAYTSATPAHFGFTPSSLQYATVPNQGDLSNWTIEAWFRSTVYLNTINSGGLPAVITTVYNDPGVIFTGQINYCMTNYDERFGFSPGAEMNISFYNGSWHAAHGETIMPNHWYHVMGTWDGTTLAVYTNGTAGNTTTLSGQVSSANGGATRIARRWDADLTDAYQYFPGDIAVSRVYNRALTSAEVTQNFNALRGRFGL